MKKDKHASERNAKVSGVMDMLEQEFQVLTAIEQGKVIGGGSGSGGGGYGSGGDYGSGGGMGSGGPGCDPLSGAQLNFMVNGEGGCHDSEYYDKVGKCWTIGVGHKLTDAEHEEILNGTLHFTHQQLMNMFSQNIATAEAEVNAVVNNQNITQNMYGAMVDLVFNAGPGDFNKSRMLADVNNGDFIAADSEFEDWNKQESRGIDTRRANEEDEFMTSGGSAWTYTPGIHTGTWTDAHSSGN